AEQSGFEESRSVTSQFSQRVSSASLGMTPIMSDSQSTNLCLGRNRAIGKAPPASAFSPANRADSRALLDRAKIPPSLSWRREMRFVERYQSDNPAHAIHRMGARAICRIRSCSPAAGPPFPWRNRGTPVSFATLPEKSRRRRQRRKPAPASPRRRNFQSLVHPSAQSIENLYRVSPPLPQRSFPPCRLMRPALFPQGVRTFWEIPDLPDDNRTTRRFPIHKSSGLRSLHRRIRCRHRQSPEFSPSSRRIRPTSRPQSR